MRWYKHEPEAFMGGTIALSLEEIGAYVLVLDAIYIKNGSIPDDVRYVSKLLRCDIRVWKRIRERLLELGKLQTSGGLLTNFRATSEISSAEVGRKFGISSAEVGRKYTPTSGKKPKQNNESKPTESRSKNKESRIKNIEEEDADAVTRARASELTEQIYDIFGFDRVFIPPTWFGLQHWLEAGLRGGWKPDLVRLAAKKVVVRSKRGPPNSFRYLGPVIVQEHELAAAPVPTVPLVPLRQLPLVSMMEPPREAPTPHHPRNWKESRDASRAAHAELKAHLAEIDAGENGRGQDAGFVAAAGRE
jgi:uncharacterized protein YdaU (DUF1376 family)